MLTMRYHAGRVSINQSMPVQPQKIYSVVKDRLATDHPMTNKGIDPNVIILATMVRDMSKLGGIK